jgi:nitrite reductase (NADH) small subunit/3-phenylpropionate/trans-cinnamate dioxygenase ferredoxin subunit
MAEFVKVALLSDVPPGSGKTVQVDGRSIAVFNAAGKIYALDDACAHMGGPLGEGALEGCIVTCPWHAWHYDVRDGKCTNHQVQVAAHEAKTEDGFVWVALAPAPKA